MKKGKTYFLSRASRAGSKFPRSLKTYIPSKIVKQLNLENGDLLKWEVRGKKLSIKVLKPVKER
jgi:antitoxin component of MazEF toxin-antitoxin module